MQEKELYKQIQKFECSLTELLNENNALEGNYLKSLYDQGYKDRNKQIQKVFREIENQLSRQEEYSSDTEYQPDNSLQDEIEHLTEIVEEKRWGLLQKIREINEIHTHHQTPRSSNEPLESYRQEINEKAKNYADLFENEGFDENALIAFLARGPAMQNNEQLLCEIDEICQKRHQLNQLKTSVQLLQEFKNILCNSEETITNLSQTALSQSFEQAINELPLHSENDNQIDLKWDAIQKLTEELQVEREQLKHNLQSDTEIPLPREFSNPQNEKVALRQTLNSLIESNRQLKNYLEDLRFKGIVTSTILPLEEVEQTLHKHRELQRLMHQKD